MHALTRGQEPVRIAPLVLHSYGAAFEELREAADRFTRAQGGQRPRVFLASMGTPREFLARSTYALNFFAAGGFEPVDNDGFADPDDAARAFAASGASLVVICSTDARYEAEVAQLAPKLHAAGARTVVLAGNPGASEARYRQAGVDRFIFVKCDVLATLRDLLTVEGVLPATSPATTS